MSKVFVPTTNDRFDLSKAAEHGEVVYLLDRRTVPNVFDPIGIAKAASQRFIEERYDPSVDYVALTGATVTVALVLAVALEMHGPVKILIFDAANERYVPRDLDLEQVVF